MKKNCNILLWIVGLLIIFLIFMIFYNNKNNENFQNSLNYKWITQGTCKSNNMQDLGSQECNNYFSSSNYNVTGSPHGPPGCWLVLGNELNKVTANQPSLKGKGFACWTEVDDGKKCSTEVPCVCK